MLLVFSVVAAGGAMPCFGGEQMVASKAAPVAMKADHSCCKPKSATAPKPAEKQSNCCCFDTLKKNAVDFNNGKATDLRIDFAILPPSPVTFELREPDVVVAQIRWPEVHGPPGIERHPVSPRAPPVA